MDLHINLKEADELIERLKGHVVDHESDITVYQQRIKELEQSIADYKVILAEAHKQKQLVLADLDDKEN